MFSKTGSIAFVTLEMSDAEVEARMRANMHSKFVSAGTRTGRVAIHAAAKSEAVCPLLDPCLLLRGRRYRVLGSRVVEVAGAS